MCRPVPSLFALFVLAAFAFGGSGVSAKEKPWYKYENRYFEAYSDASEKKVRKLLEELENFRAAVIQLAKLRVPDGAVKTQVVIFDSKREFRKVANTDLIDAFAIGIRGIPYLVMPESGASKWSKISIRHEYAHVLLGYKPYEYPNWYDEGFAEFMSSTRFRDKGRKFTIGEQVGRVKSPAPLLDWDELVSSDFEFHSISSGQKLSNAYLQSWVLVHYLTIGDSLAHNDNLNRYLWNYAQGIESPDAFEDVFGVTPGDMGDMLIKSYTRKIPYYEIDFRPGVQDHEFLRSEIPTEQITPTIDDIAKAAEVFSRD